MNENAKAWVAALRAGEFKQDTHALRTATGLCLHSYCCLGVACELYRRAHPSEAGWSLLGFRASRRPHYEPGVLPDAVRDWLDMREETGEFTCDERTSLLMLNDTGTPFNAIADLIEQHWSQLQAPWWLHTWRIVLRDFKRFLRLRG